MLDMCSCELFDLWFVQVLSGVGDSLMPPLFLPSLTVTVWLLPFSSPSPFSLFPILLWSLSLSLLKLLNCCQGTALVKERHFLLLTFSLSGLHSWKLFCVRTFLEPESGWGRVRWK